MKVSRHELHADSKMCNKIISFGFFLLPWDNQSEMHPHIVYFEKLINLNCISCCLLLDIERISSTHAHTKMENTLMSIQINQNYLNKIAFLHANKIFLRARLTAILSEINGESCFATNTPHSRAMENDFIFAIF